MAALAAAKQAPTTSKKDATGAAAGGSNAGVTTHHDPHSACACQAPDTHALTLRQYPGHPIPAGPTYSACRGAAALRRQVRLGQHRELHSQREE
jgi:hypothetical protein